MKRKEIVITGCSGYIGSHLCSLLEGEYIIHGIDIVEPTVKVDHFYNIDIVKPFYFYDVDCVIHLAALVNVGESECFPANYYNTNLNGTLNVINGIKCKNFIFASTGAAKDCVSPYGVSKRAAEDVVKSYMKTHRVDYTTFRFYNVIGSTVVPSTNPDGLFHNLLKAKERGHFTINGTDYNTVDGTCVRDYVHVEEICHSIRKAILKPANRTESLGHGIGTTVQQMIDKFKSVNKCQFNVYKGPRRRGDAESSVLTEKSDYMVNLYTLDELLRLNGSIT